MKTFTNLQEGLNDPNIFKAFFLAGGPGSGKSYVVRQTTGGTGLQIVNSDDAFERYLEAAGLSKKMPKAEEEKYYSLQELKQDHGLLHDKKWDEGLGKISDKDKVYIKACLRKGEKLTETPRIRISTIHSSKGSQAENVMLLTETMRRPYSMWRKNNSFEEDEARVFYVGLTRSQENLHLIHPMFSQGYPLPVR